MRANNVVFVLLLCLGHGRGMSSSSTQKFQKPEVQTATPSKGKIALLLALNPAARATHSRHAGRAMTGKRPTYRDVGSSRISGHPAMSDWFGGLKNKTNIDIDDLSKKAIGTAQDTANQAMTKAQAEAKRAAELGDKKLEELKNSTAAQAKQVLEDVDKLRLSTVESFSDDFVVLLRTLKVAGFTTEMVMGIVLMSYDLSANVVQAATLPLVKKFFWLQPLLFPLRGFLLSLILPRYVKLIARIQARMPFLKQLGSLFAAFALSNYVLIPATYLVVMSLQTVLR